jgi:peptidoglycan/LPS O-acetylase OafA/YrhL
VKVFRRTLFAVLCAVLAASFEDLFIYQSKNAGDLIPYSFSTGAFAMVALFLWCMFCFKTERLLACLGLVILGVCGYLFRFPLNIG